MIQNQNLLRLFISSSNLLTPICRPCLSRLRQIQRRHATTATSTIEAVPSDPRLAGHAPPASTLVQSNTLSYRIKCSVLLSRPPLLTRDLTSFEKAYFLYQRRLNERLALPFTRYFYYQKGTPGDVEWKRKIKDRLTPAREIGKYSGYGQDAWNDELLVDDRVSEPEEQVRALVRDAEDKEGGKSEVRREKKDRVIEKPMERIAEADKENDVRSLNRLLMRTLYLVVKRREKGTHSGEWVFPQSALEGKESLHTASERVIIQTGGVNMNTWVVGNMPIGHHVYNYPESIIRKEGPEAGMQGEKVFYMKARIMGGQANLGDNKFGLEDFQWLTKEEISKSIHPRDYAAVNNILLDR